MELKISNEIINQATSEAFSKLISTDNYSNPITSILGKEFSWDLSGEGKTEIAKEFKLKVQEIMANLIKDPNFHITLGEKIAEKFSEACIKDLRMLKDIKRN